MTTPLALPTLDHGSVLTRALLSAANRLGLRNNRLAEVIGTSATSWEEAAKNAVETAAKTLRDLRVGEVVKFDVTIEDGTVTSYRARVNISFKYESG